jgi:hypothetical protein
MSAVMPTDYDVLGHQVAVLAEDVYPAGNHVFQWSPQLAPGIYFVRLKVGSSVQIRRIAIVREEDVSHGAQQVHPHNRTATLQTREYVNVLQRSSIKGKIE